MAIPGPGTPIDLTDIATEFGDSAPHSVSEFYRGGGLVPDSAGNSAVPTSGAVALGNFYGSANVVALALTITSNTSNYDLYTQASSNPSYVAGATALTLTVNPGVTVSSTSTGTYALSVPNSFSPGDTVTIVNNGTIVGRGGNGGAGDLNTGNPGGAGGNAVYVNRPVSFTNTGTLAGGGGGGGASANSYGETGFWPKGGGPQGQYTISGNGGGGGAGTNVGTGGSAARPSPAVQGFANPGANGTATAGGAGGARQNAVAGNGWSGTGGSGGARGAAGTISEISYYNSNATRGNGGGAGRYMTGNPYVTWVTNGTKLGGVS